jgi:seryl-tRNA synthetase
MFRHRVALDQPLNHEQSQELARRLFFVSEQILAFDLIQQDGQVVAIDISSAQPPATAELAEKINRVVASDIIAQRPVEQKVIWQSQHSPAINEHLYEQLVERGIAAELGEGQVCLGEPFIKLMHSFDTRLRRIAVELMQGQEYQYPTLIRTDVLDRCGYFNSFPQFLMFVTRLHSDLDVYRGFLERYRQHGDVRAFALDCCDNLDYCLPPTMCFHTYHHFRDRQLGADQNLVVTARGKSFRFESRYARTLERLWDFTIREIVFIGSRDFVLERRETFMQHCFALMEELQLSGYCEVANDPFFCNQDTAARIWTQKVLEMKYELRLRVAAERTIAVGSFNFHEEFFGQNFQIRTHEGAWVRSGCVGFGLERLVYAFLCQYGLDERDWPAAITGTLSAQA